MRRVLGQVGERLLRLDADEAVEPNDVAGRPGPDPLGLPAADLTGLAAAEEAGDGEQDEHQDHQHGRGGEAALDERLLRRLHEVVRGQRQRDHRVVQRVHVERARVPRGEQHRRRLADATGDAEDDGRGEARPGGRQGDVAHGSVLGGTERVRRFLEVAGHEPEHDVGRPDDDRQHHDARGDGGGQARPLEAEDQDPGGEDEQAGEDRWQRGHGVDHRADEP
jgi:hypothetical protein